MKIPRLCTFGECQRKHYGRGYCNPHYQNFKRHGSPLGAQRADPEERFWPRVDKSGECWLWTGAQNSKGYGSFSADGKHYVSHRYAYEKLAGPIPGGMILDHLCHTPLCVRPDHLRPVSQKQNMEHRQGAQSNSRTGIRGVYPTTNGKKWTATVLHYRRTYYLGTFDRIEDAEAAVVAKRNELFTHNDKDRKAA